MGKEISYKQFGEQAILVEWKAKISDEILKDILSFKNKIENNKETFYTDLIVGYNSLTIKYRNEFSDFFNEVEQLKCIYNSKEKVEKQSNFLWEIPVCYDMKFGVDLEEISEKSQLSIKEIIQLHSENIYSVFFIGFLPGFLYLGGLNEQLYFDRKPTPRLKVEKGSVAIGGKQTGVYPIESPGGWNIIGRSPINFFDIAKQNSCFSKSGDKIKFVPISIGEFYEVEEKIKQNTYQISKTLLDD